MMTSCRKTSKDNCNVTTFSPKNFFNKKTLIFGEFFWEKKRNLTENIPVSFFGHPGARIDPKNK